MKNYFKRIFLITILFSICSLERSVHEHDYVGAAFDIIYMSIVSGCVSPRKTINEWLTEKDA